MNVQCCTERLLQNFNTEVFFKYLAFSFYHYIVSQSFAILHAILIRFSCISLLNLFSFLSLKYLWFNLWPNSPVALNLVAGEILLSKYILRLLN